MALQDAQKEAIIFYLGWPAKTLVVDSTHYSKITADRMTNLSDVTEKNVKVILAKLDNIDTQLEEARCRLSANKVADIHMDATREINKLKSERRRCAKELSCYLDIAFKCKIGSQGSVCV